MGGWLDTSAVRMSSSNGLWLQPGWELAKSNAIPHCLLHYLNHIDDDPALREKVALGLKLSAIDAMHESTAVMRNIPPTDLNLHPKSYYGVGWVIDSNPVRCASSESC